MRPRDDQILLADMLDYILWTVVNDDIPALITALERLIEIDLDSYE